ncbi:MAG: molybdopterin biosynthesis protein [Desulfobacterales bacterium]|nr:molybdopterin biosynthesis protein [Desulfobacterales bacterium]
MKRNIYLKKKSLEEAKAILFDRFSDLGLKASEIVPVPDAVGRTLAEPVFARLSSPNFHAAAMDGIAVRARDTFGVSETRPRELVVGEKTFFLNTGHVLPPQCDAVIMIENVQVIDETRVRIEAPVFPWQHVRKMGEDIVATELLFAQNHLVTPYCVGALLSGGIFSVPVRKAPRVLIIPTGSELVDWRDLGPAALAPGQVLETNSFVLGKLVEATGGTWTRHEKVSDRQEKIADAVTGAAAQGYDMVLIVGGSSAGSEDFARAVIAELGEVLVHGVTIMPGKPVIMGTVSDRPVFGIPGYPVSAIIAFEQFVRPMICRMLGRPDFEPVLAEVVPTRKIASKLGVEEFLRVKLGRVGDRITATPLPRGAGCITSITEADGIIRIPAHVEGLPAGEPAAAELLRPLSSVNNALVVVGSHDNTLDILADQVRVRHPGLTVSSSHVGSLGGLMAIRKGVCHVAGTHLLDTDDGSYNISYIQKYLPDTPVRLVNLVFRDQGLIVAKGNPKGIRGIEDLARQDVSLINRQAGSGTRILLDYRLGQIGLDPAGIAGYGDEEFTHMAVAVAVLSGVADTGMGIHAAAKALDLDFIPVVTEQYDLVIPEAFFAIAPVRILLETIGTEDFKQRVLALGGYNTDRTGTFWI